VSDLVNISKETAPKWTRLDGVDILRGLAIFFVLMNHVNMRLFLAKIPYTQGLPRQLVSSLVWNGQYGVQMFFAVSGFLIASMSLRRWGSFSALNLREFYVLRFARIAPPLLALLIVLSILHSAGLSGFIVSDKSGGLGRALVAALTFHVNVLEAQRGYFPASWDILWSLSVEEVFYMGFPIICILFGRGRLLVVCLLIFVVLGPLARTIFADDNEVWREYSYLGSMDAIALGCLTAMALWHEELSRSTIRMLCCLGTVLIVFCLFFSKTAQAWGLAACGLDMTMLAIGTCMISAMAAQTRWTAPRFIYPLLLLGRRSYEVYLTHMFVVFALFGVFKLAGASLDMVPVLFVAAIVVSALLGELVARFYSEPMNRLIRRHSLYFQTEESRNE
jgi:peptidoglycan/LPS O-acetylase OafA/YrhL